MDGHPWRLDPATRAVHVWLTPISDSGPCGIALGIDGRVWYNEARSNLVVEFDPGSQTMETVTIPRPGCVVRHMVADSVRTRFRLALSGTGRIGRIDLE